jgi:hypothetical protein
MRIVDPGDARCCREMGNALMGFGLMLTTEVVQKHLNDGTLVWVDTSLDETVICLSGDLSQGY